MRGAADHVVQEKSVHLVLEEPDLDHAREKLDQLRLRKARLTIRFCTRDGYGLGFSHGAGAEISIAEIRSHTAKYLTHPPPRCQRIVRSCVVGRNRGHLPRG